MKTRNKTARKRRICCALLGAALLSASPLLTPRADAFLGWLFGGGIGVGATSILQNTQISLEKLHQQIMETNDAKQLVELVKQVQNTGELLQQAYKQLQDLKDFDKKALSAWQDMVANYFDQTKQALAKGQGLSNYSNNLIDAFNESAVNKEYIAKLQQTDPNIHMDTQALQNKRRDNLYLADRKLVQMIDRQNRQRGLERNALNEHLKMLSNGENEMQSLKAVGQIVADTIPHLERLEDSLNSIALVTQLREQQKALKEEERERYIREEEIRAGRLTPIRRN